jgi:predicted DNA-binding transcriptional regulator YafY
MKNKRITRLLRLLQMLQSGPGKNASALAKAFKVGRRTIFRDLQELRDADLPLEYDAKTERYYVSSSWAMPPSKLTSDEALALIALATEFGRNQELPFFDAAYNAAVKLEKTLPRTLRQGLRRSAPVIKIRPGRLSRLVDKASMYRRLVDAVAQRTIVKITYRSHTEDETIETKLRPYRILFSQHSWYVIGHSSMHGEVRTFNLERFKSLETLTAKYSIPRQFDLDRHLGNAWALIPANEPENHVILRFTRFVARNVDEVKWHKSQRTKLLDDGSLEFHVTVSGLMEIQWWILRYGDQAEVLRPVKLRRIIAQRAKNMAEIYSES